jgi:hypothetical protein
VEWFFKVCQTSRIVIPFTGIGLNADSKPSATPGHDGSVSRNGRPERLYQKS